jgi:hypothetical protein
MEVENLSLVASFACLSMNDSHEELVMNHLSSLFHDVGTVETIAVCYLPLPCIISCISSQDLSMTLTFELFSYSSFILMSLQALIMFPIWCSVSGNPNPKLYLATTLEESKSNGTNQFNMLSTLSNLSKNLVLLNYFVLLRFGPTFEE